MLFIIADYEDDYRKEPEIVSLEEAQRFHNLVCEMQGAEPENLAQLTEPRCFRTNSGEDYLWVVSAKKPESPPTTEHSSADWYVLYNTFTGHVLRCSQNREEIDFYKKAVAPTSIARKSVKYQPGDNIWMHKK